VGIETDADQGLKTLQRWAQSKHNHQAMELVEQLGLYVCFNVLLFDPDTTLDSLEDNVAFMTKWAHYAFNFGRTELYAGTPLLKRMQQEGRARGDWLQTDYALHDAKVQRVFDLCSAAFRERNFASDALANMMMSTRFDVEIIRRFHPEKLDPSWTPRAKQLSRDLGEDSMRGLRSIIERVKTEVPLAGDARFVEKWRQRLAESDAVLRARSHDLAREIQDSVQHGTALTFVGDRVATPLQRAVAEVRP
jgi:hypothetical protein